MRERSKYRFRAAVSVYPLGEQFIWERYIFGRQAAALGQRDVPPVGKIEYSFGIKSGKGVLGGKDVWQAAGKE